LRLDARDAVALAASLGLRRGELFGLRWGDIDGRLLHVHRQNYGGRISETTKTYAGERTVPLFPSARTAAGRKTAEATQLRRQRTRLRHQAKDAG
jgi:integrase